jgi:hypothetical protein
MFTTSNRINTEQNKRLSNYGEPFVFMSDTESVLFWMKNSLKYFSYFF